MDELLVQSEIGSRIFTMDFMFQLNTNEKNELVAKCDRLKKLKYSTVNPYAFTEQDA